MTQSSSPSKNPLHLIALGSSFAAGPAIHPLSSRQAMRSTLNYPNLLSRRLGASLTDLTVSGATLLNVLDTSQGIVGSFPPQVQGVTSDADVVTITAGGNDIGYIGGMMRDSFGMIGNVLFPLVGPVTVPSEDEVVARFRNVVDAVRERAPKARILLVEYLTVLGPDTKSGVNVPFTEDQVARYKEVAKTVQRIYARAAEGKERCEVVDVAERSDGHGWGSMEPWVTGHGWGMFTGGEMPWHPNKRGMEAVAGMIYEHLQGNSKARL